MGLFDSTPPVFYILKLLTKMMSEKTKKKRSTKGALFVRNDIFKKIKALES